MIWHGVILSRVAFSVQIIISVINLPRTGDEYLEHDYFGHRLPYIRQPTLWLNNTKRTHAISNFPIRKHDIPCKQSQQYTSIVPWPLATPGHQHSLYWLSGWSLWVSIFKWVTANWMSDCQIDTSSNGMSRVHTHLWNCSMVNATKHIW